MLQLVENAQMNAALPQPLSFRLDEDGLMDDLTAPSALYGGSV